MAICRWIPLVIVVPALSVQDSQWQSCKQLRWPSSCDCSCWKDSQLQRRLKLAYHKTFSEKGNSRNSSTLSLEILKPYFRSREFLALWMLVLLEALKGHNPSQQHVVSYLGAKLPSDCRPGLALLALMGSQAVVTFALQEIKGKAVRSQEVGIADQAHAVSFVLNGVATELAWNCDCHETWRFSPQDVLNFRAEWLPYLKRFGAAVHETDLPHFERQMTKRNAMFLGSDCPKEADFVPIVPPQLPRLLCIIPALWPDDFEGMKEQALTSLADCDLCIFFVSSTDAPKQVEGCHVVDLSGEAEVGLDPPAKRQMVLNPITGRSELTWNSDSNLLAKASHMLLYVAEVLQPQDHFDWTCLVETDAYFVAPNFRRLVSLLQLSPKDSHWLGQDIMADYLRNGANIEPNSGSCLSAYAVQQLGRFYSGFVLRHRSQLPVDPDFFQWERPPLNRECKPFAKPSRQYLYQTCLSACFRSAGVYPTDPRNLRDFRGRLYYPNVPVDKIDVLQAPQNPTCCWGEPADMSDHNDSMIFTGFNYLFLRCRGKQRIWAADYPIVFHAHMCSNCSSTIAVKKTTMRQKAIHELLTNPLSGKGCCKGYRPGYDHRFAKRQGAPTL